MSYDRVEDNDIQRLEDIHDAQIANDARRRTEQLTGIRETLGVIGTSKKTLGLAISRIRKLTPSDSRYAKRLAAVYDSLTEIQNDISRRYLTD